MRFYAIPTPTWDLFTTVTVGASLSDPKSGEHFQLSQDMPLSEAREFRAALDRAITVVEKETSNAA